MAAQAPAINWQNQQAQERAAITSDHWIHASAFGHSIDFGLCPRGTWAMMPPHLSPTQQAIERLWSIADAPVFVVRSVFDLTVDQTIPNIIPCVRFRENGGRWRVVTFHWEQEVDDAQYTAVSQAVHPTKLINIHDGRNEVLVIADRAGAVGANHDIPIIFRFYATINVHQTKGKLTSERKGAAMPLARAGQAIKVAG